MADWRNLLSLLSLQHIESDDGSVSALLRYVFPAMLKADESIRHLRLFRVARGGVAIASSTNTNETINRLLAFEHYPQFEEALNTPNGLRDDAQRRIITPLYAGQTAAYLLEVTFKVLPSEKEWQSLNTFIDQLALAIDSRNLNRLIQSQTAAQNALQSSHSFLDIAQVFAQNMLERGQFISVNLFSFDENRTPTDFRVIATANSQEVFSRDIELDLKGEELQRFHDLLQGRDDWLISDFALETSQFGAVIQEQLQSLAIQSIYMIPLLDKNGIYGTIAVNDQLRAIALTESETQVYRNLVNQASYIIQNRDLIAKAEGEAKEAQILYQITSDLLTAIQIKDVLTILKKYIGETATGLSYAEMTYKGDKSLSTMVIQYSFADGDIQTVDNPLHAVLPAEAMTLLPTYWHSVRDNLEIVEDTEVASDIPLLEFIKARGIRASLTIPIWENGRRLGQVSLTWDMPQTFTESFLDLVRTVQKQIILVLRNQRFLFQIQQAVSESEEQVRVLQVINNITSLGNRINDEEMLLQSTLEGLKAATKVSHVGLALVDPDGLKATVVAESPIGDAIGQRVETSGEMYNKMRATREPLVVQNLDEDILIPEETKAFLKSIKIKGITIIPLFDNRDRLIGTIGLDIYDDDPDFDQATLSIATTVASQINNTIQRFRLLENTQRQAEQIQTINLFGQSIQATLALPEILQLALDFIQQIHDANDLSIYMKHAQGDDLRQVAYVEAGESIVSPHGRLITGVDAMFAEKAMQEKRVIYMSDLEDAELRHQVEDERGYVIAVPIITAQSDFGVFIIDSHNSHQLNDIDIGALQQLSNLLAVSIENANAYANTEQLSRNRAIINDISSLLQQQAEIEDIMTLTARELGKVIGAKQARIRLGVNANNKN